MDEIPDLTELLELYYLAERLKSHTLDEEVADLYYSILKYYDNDIKTGLVLRESYTKFKELRDLDEQLYSSNMERKARLEEKFIPELQLVIKLAIDRSKLFISLMRHTLSVEVINKHDLRISSLNSEVVEYVLNFKHYFQLNPKEYCIKYINLFNSIANFEFDIHKFLHAYLFKELDCIGNQNYKLGIFLNLLGAKINKIALTKTLFTNIEDLNSSYCEIRNDLKFLTERIKTSNLELLFDIIIKKTIELTKSKINIDLFWQPIEQMLSIYNISATDWQLLPQEKYIQIMSISEFNLDGFGRHSIILENHCLIQQVRIALTELPTVTNIIKVALNIGRYTGLTNKKSDFISLSQYIVEKDIIEISKYISDEFMLFIIDYLYK